MNESVLDKKIKSWEDQLLDLGKRNKMISYRETKRATLRVLKPGFDELFQKIVVDEKELTFQKAIDRDSDVRVHSILLLLDKLSCPMEVNIGDIRAEGSLPEISKTLKHLRSKAHLAMDEQGTNILYLVFGFIEWHEKESRNDAWVRSPLILAPVTLSLPSLNGQYTLKKYEDEVVVNPTLAYLFERDYGIVLPEFDPDKDTLAGFMQKMETLVDERGWRVVKECSIGLVSFLKISMYNDLIRNESQLRSNPIIRALAGERNAVNSVDVSSCEFDHDARRSSDSFQVLDADSSQQDAIALSQKGVSFVMQGPPGTGKSQTITNIIATALADGKKVLFVSEKMAALDVVYRRLTDVHLADFCLSLHSHKANKKDILNQLGANLTLKKIKVKDEEIAKLTRLDIVREQLKAYVRDIHKTIMPIEMSLYEVYGALLELASQPDIDIHLDKIDEFSKDDVNRLVLLVANLDKAQAVLGPQWYKNPWQGIRISYLEVSQKRELQNKLQDAIRYISGLEECVLVKRTLAEILTVDSLHTFEELYDHARYCRRLPNEWFHRSTEKEESLVRVLRAHKQTIDSLTRTLSDRYGSGFFELHGQDLAAQLAADMKTYRKSLRDNGSDNAAFELVENDAVQVPELQEHCSHLLTALKGISGEFGLRLGSGYTDVESGLTICEMLLEKRTLTAWYFSNGNSANLVRYASELQKRLDDFTKQKQHLSERYTAGILEYDHIEDIISRLSSAEDELSGLVDPTHLVYRDLCDMAAFDTVQLSEIEETLTHDDYRSVSSRYGLAQPATLAETHAQISAIEKLQKSTVVPAWRTKGGRAGARSLLESVITRAKKLSEAKIKLQEYFARFGIKLDIGALSESDAAKLHSAEKITPENTAIVASCNIDEAYQLLDTIDQNKTEYAELTKEIADLSEEYHIPTSLNADELLTVLHNCSGDVAQSDPCPAWATSKAEAASLLVQVMMCADDLKSRRNDFLGTFEESVFELDYAGMLNRFKADYTGLFKHFKSAYKADLKKIRLAYKQVRKKIPDKEIVALLQSLRQYNESMEHYLGFAVQVKRLLGVQNYDIWFDWGSVKKRLDAFTTVSDIFRDDSAACKFITDDGWTKLCGKLTDYAELSTWFAENYIAGRYYGNLYDGINTDTEKIRKSLLHARSMREVFVSANKYLEYIFVAGHGHVKAAGGYAEDVVNTRKWFAERADEIKKYTGIVYTEDHGNWADVLSQLKIYESIVGVTGETAGYALVSEYVSESAVIENYLAALKKIVRISGCAEAVYHIAADSTEIETIDIERLIREIHIIISGAECLKSVCDYISGCCSEDCSGLSISEIKDDLDAVLSYQKTRDNFAEIEKDARLKLGPDYNGMTADWDVIYKNISFCNKVIQLAGGTVSQELISAFTKGTSPYSRSGLSELRQRYETAKRIEAEYPTLGKHKDLNEKVQILAGMIAVLNRMIAAKTSICGAAYAEYKYSEIIEDLNSLAKVQKEQNAFNSDLGKAKQVMPTLALDTATDWNSIAEIFNHLKQVKRAVGAGNIDAEVSRFVMNGIPGVSVDAYGDKIEKLLRNKQVITELTSLFATKAALESYDLSKLARRLRNCNDQFATLDAWIDLRDCKKACVDNGLGSFVETAEDTCYPEGTLKDIFLKSFYYEWFEKICTGIGSVSAFRVRTQESRVEEFRELDSHQLPVNQMRIRERLIREMPNKLNFGRATDEMSVLLHELNKKRNIIPLRKLFREIPNLLLKLKPCLMMSPLSVSYFLEAETYRFDMVIFDEASQIFPQDAIGAIFRAKQVIIAGDSKQLPPTNFFAASTSNDADFDNEDEEEEAVNFDSILEEASNSLMNRSLLWHYRSRYEELISFSNRQIYQGSLITFPSSTVQEPDTGVEYVYVRNGVYENRCNRAEAQEIVRLVADHIRRHPNRSLGVIAFSESQQSVIEDEINKYRMHNPANERFFNEDADEPFFIKNLENVQGDERDTIIFSVCYAKNAQGRMYMRFGPLGQQGGERRLNVAITRAKYNIKLVGSIYPEDIDLSKTKSEGVRMLRAYISFAMHGGAGLPKPEKKNALYEVDTFSEQIVKFLESHGYTVKKNVGSSDYTVDIAVEHPEKPGHYVAGIECDGNSYYMAKTVSDRERLRTAILKQMGWKMYRVWSTEWIRNPEAEQTRLMAFITDALRHHGEKTAGSRPSGTVAEEDVVIEVVKTDASQDSQNADNPYDLPLYKEGKWWEGKDSNSRDNLTNIANMVRAVVKVEQPIHMELMYKRVSQGLTTGKATQSVRYTIDQAIKGRMLGEIVIEDQFMRFRNFTDIQARRSEVGAPDRPIEYVSIPEIACAMEKILIGAYGMDRSVLCAEAARVFGFERTGAKIKQRTGEAVDYLIRSRKVSTFDDKIQLLEG